MKNNPSQKESRPELQDIWFALNQHAIVTCTDETGNITFANEKLTQISGYSKEELLGQNHRLFNSGYHDAAFYDELYKTLFTKGVWQGELCDKAKNGTCYWLKTTITKISDNDDSSKKYISISADISEQKNAKKDLLTSHIIAENAMLAKTDFLASMSHEIRTPMNGVLGLLGLLKNSPLNTEQQYRVSLAQKCTQSLLTLVNSILDFSKAESGKLALESSPFNLSELLTDLTKTLAYQAQAKGIELILDETAIKHPLIQGDPARIQQIFTNIIGNAIKFTLQGEIVIRVELQTHTRQYWMLNGTVTDNGIGIPAESIPLLFDKFSQVDASTSRKFGGTGLGLAIVKKLCLLMNGDITVTSKIGKGSCFNFRIPVQKSKQSQSIKIPDHIKTLSLLIIDSNQTHHSILSRQLQSWGAKTTLAKNADHALSLCEDRIKFNDDFFDFALIEMNLTPINGIELGKKIKNDDRFNSMKLIMMTTMANQNNADYFENLGFVAHFPKPATATDLLKCLANKRQSALSTTNILSTPDLPLPTNTSSLTKSSNIWPENTRLLLVEDNLINQHIMLGIINNLGLEIDIANNGVEALNKLNNNQQTYSLILMDCQMPEMDGYQATQRIREGHTGKQYKSIPIIAITAHAMNKDRDKCLAIGMNDYLIKPIDHQLLVDKLTHWLLEEESNINQPEIKPCTKTEETTELPIWDKASAMTRVSNLENILHIPINLFIQEIPKRLATLQQTIQENKDIEDIRIQAHNLKGVASNLSGMRLHQQCLMMEKEAKAGDIEKIFLLFPELKAAGEQLKEFFEQYLESTKAPK
ncbi:MAG: response regulator [Methylococcales bacterium]|jgi:PAS domain S-box-containing protein|nr:response regulator [Methylococcales bacterium]MBT7408804.1 response regulator [Methylococcales bacterium]